MYLNPQPLYFKLTYQLIAVLDKTRRRLHIMLHGTYEPDLQRLVRANTIAQFQRTELPEHLGN